MISALIGILLQITITFSSHVDHALKQFSYQEKEFMVCLRALEVDSAKYLVDQWMLPVHKKVEDLRVVAVPCPRNYPILFHTHPVVNMGRPDIREYYEKHAKVPLIYQRQLLYLSSVDMRETIIKGIPIVIVGSDGRYAWWTYNQVLENYGRILLPIKGQVKLK